MDLAQRPPYDTVDFKALTKKNPDFKLTWQKCSGKLDFQDPETIKTLSRAILVADFGLQLEVPDDRLCPPIPNRWNYVSWIQGLIDSTSPDYSDRYDPDRKVIGLDIGTGASAIYTMLCLQSRSNWTMCATDVDKKSFESAARNLALNSLMTRTKLLQTTELNALIPMQALGIGHLDFTICNPPFFTDASDMTSSLKGEGKSWKPNAVCTGAEIEMVCDGGDLGFVTKIVNESLVLKEKVQWYSSMLGKLSSAKSIIDLLKKHGITNWAVGVIDTGSSTKRWVVAWSFSDLRPKNVRPTTTPNITAETEHLTICRASPVSKQSQTIPSPSLHPTSSTSHPQSRPQQLNKLSKPTSPRSISSGAGTKLPQAASAKRAKTSGVAHTAAHTRVGRKTTQTRTYLPPMSQGKSSWRSGSESLI
jgi:23S rRNA (adenine1618-N6)-methyltransferase